MRPQLVWPVLIFSEQSLWKPSPAISSHALSFTLSKHSSEYQHTVSNSKSYVYENTQSSVFSCLNHLTSFAATLHSQKPEQPTTAQCISGAAGGVPTHDSCSTQSFPSSHLNNNLFWVPQSDTSKPFSVCEVGFVFSWELSKDKEWGFK